MPSQWRPAVPMRTVTALLSLAVALAFPTAAVAGNAFDDATQLRIGEAKMEDISTYDHDIGDPNVGGDGEPMTPAGPGTCPKTGGGFVEALKTAWFSVPPTGRELTAEIGGGIDDGLIATNFESDFQFGMGTSKFCNWWILPTPASAFTLRWTAAHGKFHFLQVGKCRVTDVDGDECAGSTPGFISVYVRSAPPGNADRASAASVIPTSGQALYDNHGTDTGGDGVTSCGGAQIRSSVWFKGTAPQDGTAIITATPTPQDPLDLALQAYRAGETTPLDCNDPAGTAPGRVTIDVTGGTEYFMQVASTEVSGGTPDQGTFDFDVQFLPKDVAPDTDRDKDGDGNDSDCAPDDPTRHHGAADIYDNGIDENCDNADNLDFDGDGFKKKPPFDDCDDRDHSVHPHAGEVRGDRIDQDCNGVKEPGSLPFLGIDLKANRHSPGKLIFGRVRVSPVRNGYRVKIACVGGRRKGCPRRGITRTIKKGTSFQSNYTYAKVLSNGAAFEVTVTRPGANSIGFVRRFTVRKGRLRQRTCEMVPRDENGRAFKRRC